MVEKVMFDGCLQIRMSAWVLAIACLFAIPVQAQEPVRDMARQITEGLAQGRDVSGLLATVREQNPRPHPRNDRSEVAGDAGRAEQALLVALEGANAKAPAARQIEVVMSAYENWQAVNVLMSDRFGQIASRMERAGIQGEYNGRLEKARSEFETARQQVVNSLEACAEALYRAGGATQGLADTTTSRLCMKSVKAALQTLQKRQVVVQPRILRGSVLPFHRARTAPRSLPATTPIVPAYLSPLDMPALPADSASTAELAITPLVAAKAKALDYDYVRLYEYVRNNVKTEWYAGAQKSLDGTLAQLSGNDIDQASLLIALYRASGASARYVHGVIEVPVEDLQQELGVSLPTQVTAALTQAGIAYTSVIRGGKLAALHIEHTWAEVRVPYTNYRGTTVDRSGEGWVALMPAIKRYIVTPPDDIWQRAGLDTTTVVSRHLESPLSLTPLETIRQRINAYRESNGVSGTYAGHLGGSSPVVENLDLLPNSLPVKVVSVLAEAAALSNSQQNTIRLRLNVAGGSGVSLDYQATVSQLAGHRVTLSYIPATVEDDRLTNTFGGIDRVPLYLIRVRPQLKVNGVIVAYGKESLEPGLLQTLEIVTSGPAGEERAEHQVLAGAIEALSIQTQQPVRMSEDTRPDDTDSLAAKLLYRVAADYATRWMEAEQELGALRHTLVLRPMPNVVVVSSNYQPERVQGRLQHLRWSGVTMDAVMHPIAAVARGANDTSGEWMQLSSLQGSALEQDVFSDLFLVNSISADKGIAVATSNGIAIQMLSGSSSAAVEALQHPDVVKDDIRKWLALGYTVTVPQTIIGYEDWAGSVWRVEDKVTGAAGYFIAGGLAGAESALAPSRWPLDWLRDAMLQANLVRGGGGTTVARLIKVGASDGQKVEVGEALPTPLTVRAEDEKGLPVKNAAITFTATTGGGTFDGDSATFTIMTDETGFASAVFKPGTSIGESGKYYKVNPNDEHPQLIGVNEIDVYADGRSFGMRPFIAYGLPGPATDLVRTNPRSSSLAQVIPSLWSDTVILQARDEFGNAVANAQIEASGNESVQSTCEEPSRDPRSLRFFGGNNTCLSDVTYACASSSLRLKTTSFDAAFYVVAGNAKSATYTARFSLAGAGASHTEDYRTLTGVCELTSPAIGMYSVQKINSNGELNTAAKIGEAIEDPVSVSFYSMVPKEIEAIGGVSSCTIKPSADVELKPVDGIGSFTFTTPDGGSAVGSMLSASSVQARLTAGLAPRLYRLNLKAEDVRFKAPMINHGACSVDMEGQDLSLSLAESTVSSFYGVKPVINQLEQQNNSIGNPNVLSLDVQGYPEAPASLLYSIEPAEFRGMQVHAEYSQGGYELGSTTGGSGSVKVPRTQSYDPSKEYKATLYVNGKMKSEQFVLPTYSRLFRSVNNSGHIYSEIDVVNEDICETASTMGFELSEEAVVEVKFISQISAASGGAPIDGSEHIILNERLPAGKKQILITSGQIPPGQYKVVIKGVRVRNGSTESAPEGSFTSEHTRIDLLAVGRTIVQGVDVASGTYSMSSVDFSLPGRTPLTFSRSYGGGSSYIGALGIGWGHNFDSSVKIDRCGRVFISGGAGGGMRFQPMSDGSLRPYKGYHGTMIANQVDHSFDFYSKDGTRYHYRNFGWQGIHPEWNLEYIEDTNGNKTGLAYDSRPRDAAKLIAVVDSAGRQITFDYVEKAFKSFVKGVTAPDGSHTAQYATELKEVIDGVDGPGYRIQFTYDDYGRLTEARRSGSPDRVETYAYAADPLSEPIPLAHVMRKYTDPRRNDTVIRYQLQPMSWSVRDGEQILTVTPEMGVVDSVTLPSLDNSSFNYDFVTRRTSVSQGGASTSYTWDKYGRVTRQSGPAGTVDMEWSPDDIVLLNRNDERGYGTTNTYDSFGNVTSEQRDGYRRTAFFTPLGQYGQIRDRKDWQADRNGNRTSFDYDARGNLTSMTDAASKTTNYSYASNGDLLRTTNPRGASTSFEYDEAGNVTQVKDAKGYTVSTSYDERYRKKSVTDQEGNTTTYDYDDNDYLIRVGFEDGSHRSMKHDAMGNLLWEEDEMGRRTSYQYDGQGKVTHIQRPDGAAKSISYDGRGNKDSETDWMGRAITFNYNSANCMIERREPLGKTTTYTPDAHCNVTSEKDALGRITEYDYDGYNRVTEKREPLGKKTTYHYDGENKIRETDTYNRETWLGYDNMNRLKHRIEKDRDTGTGARVDRKTSYTYDAVGNMETETDALGRISQYRYDSINRRERYEDREGAVRTYEYWPSGRLSKETVRLEVGSVTTSHEYDSRGRLRFKTDAEGGRWSYEYYPNGDLKSETWPNGNVVTHTYNDVGLRRTSNDRIGSLGEWDYDANGKTTLQVDGNGNRTVMEYNALGYLDKRTSAIVTQGGSGRTIVDYEPDLMGFVQTETTDRGATTRYTYNNLYQLTDIYQLPGASEAELHQHYEYDLLGNRTLERDARGNSVTQAFNGFYQLIRRSDAIGVQEYTYDLLGNKKTEKDRRGLITNYDYDREGRLDKVSRNGVMQWDYDYDKLGRRYRETDANGNATTYVFDGVGRVKKESRPETAITTHLYNVQGERTDTYLPEGQQLHFKYDLRSRQTESHRLFKLEPRAAEVTKYDYDLNNNRISMQRPKSNKWEYRFNEANLLWKIISPAGTTTYTYDTAGNLTNEVDGANRTTSYTYDLLNRRKTMSWVGGGESYAYDGNGNRTHLTDAKGQTFVYQFDVLNRLVTRSGPGTQTVYTLDKNGNPDVIAETDAAGTRESRRQYDSFDRLVSETDVHGVKVGYTYYPNGARKTRTDPDGATVSYGIDGLSRIRSVTQGSGTATYDYDRSSRLVGINYPASSIVQAYDEADRLKDITHSANGGVFAQWHYEYDPNGNRTLEQLTAQQGTEATTYSYDTADRLKTVVYPEAP